MPEQDMAGQKNISTSSEQLFVKTVNIDAPASKVWNALRILKS